MELYIRFKHLTKSNIKGEEFCKNVSTATRNLIGVKSLNRFGGHINQLIATTVVLNIR